MKTSILIALVAMCSSRYAQFSLALQSLIDAEKNFAQTSVDKSIKTAFLSNLNEQSIVFSQGEPVNGPSVWRDQEESEGYLFWWPVFADIASSEDLGYTTGPAVFGPSRAEQKANGGIYYSSVWKRDKAGVWKIAVDLGSCTFPADGAKKEPKTSATPLAKKSKTKKVTAGTEEELLTLDKTYVDNLNKTKKSFSSSYFSNESRLHRPRIDPLISLAAIQNYKEDNHFEFEHSGGGVSASGDMGYTYGKVKVERMKDGQPQVIPVSYMRVWRKENNKWKIVLDVIGG